MANSIFVAGIGTGVGKTVCSAVLCQALQADYWKPIQTGAELDSDSKELEKLVSFNGFRVFPEAYRFKEPLSPHIAAEKEAVVIDPAKITLPQRDKRIVVEGAGGLMVPIRKTFLFIDWLESRQMEVVLVVRHYLGSINHTLMSLEVLKHRKIKLKGIIYVGADRYGAEEVINLHSECPVLLRMEEVNAVNADFVAKQAEKIDLTLL